MYESWVARSLKLMEALNLDSFGCRDANLGLAEAWEQGGKAHVLRGHETCSELLYHIRRKPCLLMLLLLS